MVSNARFGTLFSSYYFKCKEIFPAALGFIHILLEASNDRLNFVFIVLCITQMPLAEERAITVENEHFFPHIRQGQNP